MNMWVAAVDFRKAFDCVEHEALWSALGELGAPLPYIKILKRLYAAQTAKVWRRERE